mmetsp:Transcript_80310/g.222141  ORF Transcript_80310/g.222141 Transcript_80310/m.222141 type:complete len:237 (+) Transcript_80310:191-901(+)
MTSSRVPTALRRSPGTSRACMRRATDTEPTPLCSPSPTSTASPATRNEKPGRRPMTGSRSGRAGRASAPRTSWTPPRCCRMTSTRSGAAPGSPTASTSRRGARGRSGGRWPPSCCTGCGRGWPASWRSCFAPAREGWRRTRTRGPQARRSLAWPCPALSVCWCWAAQWPREPVPRRARAGQTGLPPRPRRTASRCTMRLQPSTAGRATGPRWRPGKSSSAGSARSTCRATPLSCSH